MMPILAISATIVGALFGLRFKIFVLVPAIAIGSAATFCFGVAHNNSLSPILLTVVFAVSAQIGYFGGLVIRFARARGGRQRYAWDCLAGTTACSLSTS